jgi:hypothetical protein
VASCTTLAPTWPCRCRGPDTGICYIGKLVHSMYRRLSASSTACAALSDGPQRPLPRACTPTEGLPHIACRVFFFLLWSKLWMATRAPSLPVGRAASVSYAALPARPLAVAAAATVRTRSEASLPAHPSSTSAGASWRPRASLPTAFGNGASPTTTATAAAAGGRGGDGRSPTERRKDREGAGGGGGWHPALTPAAVGLVPTALSVVWGGGDAFGTMLLTLLVTYLLYKGLRGTHPQRAVCPIAGR